MKFLATKFLLLCIRFYQLVLSPLLGPRCRYQPTCSNYARTALKKHGPWHGSKLAAKRIMRCHPLGGHGYDPVPDSLNQQNTPKDPAQKAKPTAQKSHKNQ